MKTIIFIDGENFVYQLRDTLAKRRLIKYRDELARVDIRALLAHTLQDEGIKQASIRYYASKVHVIDRTPELKERTERYAADAEVWKKVLESQRIEFVEAGHLLVRDGKPCQECGHREPVLTEKGVDVQLATDLIRSSGDNVNLVLLSSDGDLMPAVEESKRRGSELTYVGFRGVSNAALSRIATKRYTITTKLAAAVLGPKPKKKKDSEPTQAHTEQSKPKQTRVNQQKSQHQHNHADQTVSENADAKQPAATQKNQKPSNQQSKPKQSRNNNRQSDNNRASRSSATGAITGSRLASILPSLPIKSNKTKGE